VHSGLARDGVAGAAMNVFWACFLTSSLGDESTTDMSSTSLVSDHTILRHHNLHTNTGIEPCLERSVKLQFGLKECMKGKQRGWFGSSRCVCRHGSCARVTIERLLHLFLTDEACTSTPDLAESGCANDRIGIRLPRHWCVPQQLSAASKFFTQHSMLSASSQL